MKIIYKSQITFHPQEEWAGPIMWMEMAFGGLGGGLFLSGVVFGSVPGVILGFLILAACKGLLLLMDLGKPTRFLNVFKRPFHSWISFGAVVFLLYCVIGFVYCLMLFMGMGGGFLELLKVMACILAIILISYDGLFLSASTGVASWSASSVLPMLYACNASAGGLGLLLLIGAVTGESFQVTNYLMIALTGELICIVSYLASLCKGRVGARESYKILMHDELKGSFVYGAVACGMVIPLILALAVVMFGISTSVLLAGAVLQVAGVILLRVTILKAGVFSPVA